MQSVHITTNVVSSNRAQKGGCTGTHYVVKSVSDLRQVGGLSPGTPVSSTNKTDCHDIAKHIVESNVKHHRPTNQPLVQPDPSLNYKWFF